MLLLAVTASSAETNQVQVNYPVEYKALSGKKMVYDKHLTVVAGICLQPVRRSRQKSCSCQSMLFMAVAKGRHKFLQQAQHNRTHVYNCFLRGHIMRIKTAVNSSSYCVPA